MKPLRGTASPRTVNSGLRTDAPASIRGGFAQDDPPLNRLAPARKGPRPRGMRIRHSMPSACIVL